MELKIYELELSDGSTHVEADQNSFQESETNEQIRWLKNSKIWLGFDDKIQT